MKLWPKSVFKKYLPNIHICIHTQCTIIRTCVTFLICQCFIWRWNLSVFYHDVNLHSEPWGAAVDTNHVHHHCQSPVYCSVTQRDQQLCHPITECTCFSRLCEEAGGSRQTHRTNRQARSLCFAFRWKFLSWLIGDNWLLWHKPPE